MWDFQAEIGTLIGKDLMWEIQQPDVGEVRCMVLGDLTSYVTEQRLI